MPINRLLCLFLCWSLGAGVVAAQTPNLDAPLPLTGHVRMGTLGNGLRYYIQQNQRPRERVELRLAVRAGSVQEDDDQRGAAHLVEHMAFNGSTHFPKHELVHTLQSMGVKFGADLNAYTSFLETVYQLPLPSNDVAQLERAFLVLQDWAQGLQFAPADVRTERQIVLEEWRQGKGAEDRIDRALLPLLLADSIYAQRLPIGTESGILNASSDSLRRFYQDWYRPDLMAVMVVGDIDPEATLALLRRTFSPLRGPNSPRPLTPASLPGRTQAQAAILTDAELTDSTLMLHYPVQVRAPLRTWRDYRAMLVERLITEMLGQRMALHVQRRDPPYVQAGSGWSAVLRGYQGFSSAAAIGRAGVGAALRVLVQENERALRHGFSEPELARAKSNLRRAMESAHAERGATDSATYAQELLRHFLDDEGMPGIEAERAATQTLLPDIDLALVQAQLRQHMNVDAAVLLVYTGPDRAALQGLDEAALLQALRTAQAEALTLSDPAPSAMALMSQLPPAGSVVHESYDARLDVHHWTLSNGVRVVLKATDFQQDQVLLSAQRFGGHSRFDREDLNPARWATAAVSAMGLGNHSPTELDHALAGKIVSAGVGLTATLDVVSASASNADVESMLQWVWLKFAPPRLDAVLFDSFIQRAQDSARHNAASPDVVFTDRLQSTLYQDHPRLLLTPRAQDFDNLEMERLAHLYQTRFSSAQGLVFVLVGSFAPEALRPLVARYLGSLPTPELAAGFVDHGLRPVSGRVQKTVQAGREDKARLAWVYTAEAPYSESAHLRLRALLEILEMSIMSDLREQRGLIYSANVSGSLERIPYPHYYIGLSLPCASDQVATVAQALQERIAHIRREGVSEAELEKVRQHWIAAHKRQLRDNSAWLAHLQTSVLHGSDATQVHDFAARVAALTPQDVQQAAQQYLRPDQVLQMEHVPELPSRP